jgi:general stress protein YciG
MKAAGSDPTMQHSESEESNRSEDELKPDAPPSAPEAAAPPRKRRGFAAMDPKLVSEISRKGGKAAHSAGTAHEFSSDEARAAGRKGGLATHAKRGRSAEAKPSGEG